ncbi:toprim domain-containing protein [Brucella pituitosa]|uniref:toprim domain-containing protein n=1 Tax=Brucella pituitosa TaxID=571256 RepID=UPI00192D0905|nr:toprim domain-containing protein [Brucella pituitosa]
MENKPTGVRPTRADLLDLGEPSGWPSRGISEDSAQKWGFTKSTYSLPAKNGIAATSSNEPVRVFNYRNASNQVVAQKVRFKGKDFRFLGDTKEAGLYGMHLWRDRGKRVVIVEGEMDAISLSQMQGHKWPVVSIPNGAQGAAKALSKNIDWLEQFDEIVLLFDNDEAGQVALDDCKKVAFTPGKLRIARLPEDLKDANEALVAGRIKETLDCLWDAKVYRPDGILSVDDIMDDILTPTEMGIPWWLPGLTDATYGRRYGEIYAVGAGTGVGKTDFLMQQIAYDINDLELTVGAIFLEQRPRETAQRVAGKLAGKMFHIPNGDWNAEELRRAASELQGKVFFYDNFGQTDWDVVKGHIRYMAVSLGVRVFYLDHLTAMADTGDEKGSIEQIMKEMAGIAQELDIIITFVSHLSTPDGKPHEEGGRVMIRHFKGSRAIGFWSYFMFGLERDQQADDPEIKTTTIFRILKDRYTGKGTGQTFLLGFDQEAGRLFEREDDPFKKQDSASHGFRDETRETEPEDF